VTEFLRAISRTFGTFQQITRALEAGMGTLAIDKGRNPAAPQEVRLMITNTI
jgi:hypothetical protein